MEKRDEGVEDEEIVELYLRRDESAIAQAGKKYGVRLRSIAHNILDDLAAAEECENDAYLATWNSIPPHEPRTYLFAFLARIIRHISLDYCRKRNRLKRNALLVELVAEMEQCIPAPDDTESRIENAEFGKAVSGFLRELPEAQSNVFLRRYWYLDSIAAISARNAMSQSRIKSMLFRTRNKLRKYLEKEGYTL